MRWLKGLRKELRRTYLPKSLTEVGVASSEESESFAASMILYSGKAVRCHILSSSKTKNGFLDFIGAVSENILRRALQLEEDFAYQSFQSMLQDLPEPICFLTLINDKMFSFRRGEASHIYAFDVKSQVMCDVEDHFLSLKSFTGYLHLITISARNQKIVDYLRDASQRYLLPSIISIECAKLAKDFGLNDFSISSVGLRIPITDIASLRKLKLFSALSDIGLKRTTNEDAVMASNIKYSSSSVTRSLFLLLVADGAGGHLHGEEASKEALISSFVEILKSGIISSNNDIEGSLSRLRDVVQKVNDKIVNLRETKRSDLATTLTMALVLGRNVFVAHCGDSRMYVLKGDQLTLATEDHKYVVELVRAGLMTAEEAKISPQRSVLTSALGMRNPRIDIKCLQIDGDESLLLCSDGLTDLVSEEEVKAYLSHYKYPSIVAQALIDLANSRGGFDNISVAVMTPGSIIF